MLESAVFGAPHPDFGEGVTAVVVPRPSALITEASVLAALGERLAKFKMPKRVVIVDLLPRNTMGKVQKATLREAYKGIYAVPTASQQIPAVLPGPIKERRSSAKVRFQALPTRSLADLEGRQRVDFTRSPSREGAPASCAQPTPAANHAPERLVEFQPTQAL